MKKNKSTTQLLLFLVILSTLIVFRALYTSGTVVWGDAPFFPDLGLKSLLSENYLWTTRGINLGGLNQFLWFYPYMFLYGLVHAVFGLTNEVIIRLLFYIPSIVISLYSGYLFARFLGFDRSPAIVTGFVYVFNTYFLLLLDGGQVGIALAYGLFPLVLLILKKLVDEPKAKFFWLSLIISQLLIFIDPRVFIIAVTSLFVWLGAQSFADRKNLFTIKIFKRLILLFISLVGINAYWLIPTFQSRNDIFNIPSSDLGLVSLLNTLLLYQPHWPTNMFGVVHAPVFYFAIVPILIFAGIFLKPRRVLVPVVVLFLTTAFLAKGATHPLGQIYKFMLTATPAGIILRDSTKFFIPLFLFGGVLISYTADIFQKRFYRYALIGIIFLFALLTKEAFLGQLPFSLSSRSANKEVQNINQQLDKEEEILRSIWFPERHPQAYHTDKKQALDAKTLVDTVMPLAALNVGDYDRYNYLHSEKFIKWYRLLGIKYLVLSGDPRVTELNTEQQKNWQDLNELIATSSSLLKKDWGSIPVYEVENIKKQVLASDLAIGVIGGPEKVNANIPMFFFEDGKLDPRQLQKVASHSALLYFDQKNERDLQASFLRQFFIAPVNATKSAWSTWGNRDYLKWRYEALIRGIDTKEFDYGKGIAFSEIEGEEIEFNLPASEEGNYSLMIRAQSRIGSEPLLISIDGKESEFLPDRNNFQWFEKSFNLQKGPHKVTVRNNGGFWLLNTLGLVPENNVKTSIQLANNFINHFKVIDDEEFDSLISNSKWKEVSFNHINPVTYQVEVPQGISWIMTVESFNPGWQYSQEDQSIPIYSSFNGFYVRDNASNIKITFANQQYSRWGMYFSALSVLIISILFIYERQN